MQNTNDLVFDCKTQETLFQGTRDECFKFMQENRNIETTYLDTHEPMDNKLLKQIIPQQLDRKMLDEYMEMFDGPGFDGDWE